MIGRSACALLVFGGAWLKGEIDPKKRDAEKTLTLRPQPYLGKRLVLVIPSQVGRHGHPSHITSKSLPRQGLLPETVVWGRVFDFALNLDLFVYMEHLRNFAMPAS
jgi:hypothetical protein